MDFKKSFKWSYCLMIGIVLFSCQSNNSPKNSTKEKRKSTKVMLNVPYFARTPEALQRQCDEALKSADQALDRIAREQNNTFENTIIALDTLFYQVDKMIGPQYLLMNVSTEAKIREAANQSVLKHDKWSTQVFFRQDIYQAVTRYAKTRPRLRGEDKMLLQEIMRRFKRNGFGLPREKRKKLEQLKIELGLLCNSFKNNIKNYNNKVAFTGEELKGVPRSALQVLEKDARGNYLMDSRIWAHYAAIARFAVNEETRYKAHVAKRSIAQKENSQLLKQIIRARGEIAQLLGYKNFADYNIEIKMAGKSAKAIKFLKQLSQGVEKKFQQEQETLRQLKVRETKQPAAKLNYWDGMFYERILFNEQYQFDMEEMKNYFSMVNCLTGMFKIYQRIFGIIIRQDIPPNNYLWHKDVSYYEVIDAAGGEQLGGFYLDLYPREGKYNHFAEFEIMGGKVLADGTRERPVCALVCNFPQPTKTAPSLLDYDNVTTLFHEFGHAMHVLLSKTKYRFFHGTNVPGDFVEAPSQMLEQWLTDKKVLDTFAFHYQARDQKIPADFMDKLEKVNKATIARNTRGQIAYAMIDLMLHTQYQPGDDFNVIQVTNQILEQYWMSYSDRTSMATGFGHLGSDQYAAGYYGYKWAEAIAYDMAALFKRSKDGFLDTSLGMKLRKEIYEPGGSRDVNLSIRAFLGRNWSSKAYFDYLGIQ